MPANTGHIWMPLGEYERWLGEQDEYDAQTKVYKKPSRARKRLPGKALEILNTPVIDHQGKKRFFNSLQVATMAYSRALAEGADVIRVKTPEARSEPGGKFLEEIDFSMARLKELRRDPCFFPDVLNGVVRFEDEAANKIAPRWEITESGIWCPTVR